MTTGDPKHLTDDNKRKFILLEDHQKLTIKELAALLNVSPRCVQRWAQQGKIPVLRLSRRCSRFDLKSVERALSRYEKKEVSLGS